MRDTKTRIISSATRILFKASSNNAQIRVFMMSPDFAPVGFSDEVAMRLPFDPRIWTAPGSSWSLRRSWYDKFLSANFLSKSKLVLWPAAETGNLILNKVLEIWKTKSTNVHQSSSQSLLDVMKRTARIDIHLFANFSLRGSIFSPQSEVFDDIAHGPTQIVGHLNWWASQEYQMTYIIAKHGLLSEFFVRHDLHTRLEGF